MNGIHDMGGMHGFGPVVREANEPVFHEPWEGRVYAMNSRLRGNVGPGKVGGLRDTLEQLPPQQYLAASYYERWLAQLEIRAIRSGLVSEGELAERIRALQTTAWEDPPHTPDPHAAEWVHEVTTVPPQPKPATGAPLFQAGDPVMARTINWHGHNRLPRYIRGRRGVVERVNGWYPIEDANQDRLGRNPQPLYTVVFTGAEVWGPGCEPNLRVYLELWEGYLEPASSPK